MSNQALLTLKERHFFHINYLPKDPLLPLGMSIMMAEWISLLLARVGSPSYIYIQTAQGDFDKVALEGSVNAEDTGAAFCGC